MDNDTITQITSPGRRAAAYWFADGLEEIAFGFLFLVSGTAGLVFHYWPHKWLAVVCLIFFIGLWVLFWADRPILDFFKARITYPRTGYARPPQNPAPDQDILVDSFLPDKRRGEFLTLFTARAIDENVTAFKARTVFVLMAANVAVEWWNSRWSIAILMAAAAFLIFILNRREPRPYSAWSVLPMAVAGLLSAAIELSSESRQKLPLVIGGAWLLWTGAWTLVRYLRDHPKPNPHQEEHP
jgi:hypothetical protein